MLLAKNCGKATFADQAFSGWKDFPIRFDMLLPLAVLTLLSIGLVYMPFWVQLAVTVLASPAVPFTYERLSVGRVDCRRLGCIAQSQQS